MRWLKHLSMAHEHPKVAELLETEGPVAYGVYWLLLELIAATMEPGSDQPELTHSESCWAQKLCVSARVYKRLLVRMTGTAANLGQNKSQSGHNHCPELIEISR
jgi:hypothetical protein